MGVEDDWLPITGSFGHNLGRRTAAAHLPRQGERAGGAPAVRRGGGRFRVRGLHTHTHTLAARRWPAALRVGFYRTPAQTSHRDNRTGRGRLQCSRAREV